MVECERKSRGELNRPKGAKAVVGERRRIDDAKDAPLDVAAAVEGVFVFRGQRIPEDRVDAEVSTASGVLHGHERIAGDVESLVPASGFRVAPRQRDVEVSQFEDLKARADRLDASE